MEYSRESTDSQVNYKGTSIKGTIVFMGFIAGPLAALYFGNEIGKSFCQDYNIIRDPLIEGLARMVSTCLIYPPLRVAGLAAGIIGGHFAESRINRLLNSREHNDLPSEK